MQRQVTGTPPALGQMTGLAKCIALPHDFAPQRYPSYPALERTAVLGFSAPLTWTSTSLNSANKFMLTRQAAWPLWGEIPYTTANGYTVDYAIDNVNVNVPTATTKIISKAIGSWAVGNRPASNLLAGVTGLGNFFSPYPIMGVDGGGIPFVYVPSGGIVNVVGNSDAPNSTGTTASIEATFEWWTSPGEVMTYKKTFNTQSTATNYGTFYGSISGFAAGYGYWLRPVSIQGTTVTPTTSVSMTVVYCGCTVSWGFSTTANPLASITVPLATTCLQPLCLPVEFANTTLPWYATRTTAAAALLTNVTQVLNKAGTFLGGRISPNIQNPWTVTTDYVGTLHPAEKNQLSAEEGFYTYVPPSTDLANFWDYTLPTGGGAAACPVYRLDNDSLVNVFFHTDPVAASYSVTVDWHIEFRTTSALFPIAVCSMPLESLHQAQLALATTGFFFNNWNHEKIRAIISNIGKYLLSTNPYGRAVTTLYKAGKAIAMGRQPRPYAQPTRYISTGAPRRGKRKGKKPRRPKRAPQPPPDRPFKPKSGLAMYLSSKGK